MGRARAARPLAAWSSAASGRALVGPRRIAILVDGFDPEAGGEEKRGPAEGVAFDGGGPTRAAEGFARGLGLPVEDLEVRDGYVWGHQPPAPLPERLWRIAAGLATGKTMMWDLTNGVRFPRPIRWLCAKLDAETLDVGPDGIPSGSVSYGHRFTSGERGDRRCVRRTSAALRDAGVVADAGERRTAIVAGLDALGSWSDPYAVLDEVVYLVESPVVLAGAVRRAVPACPRAGDRDGDAVPPALLSARRKPVRLRRERRRPRDGSGRERAGARGASRRRRVHLRPGRRQSGSTGSRTASARSRSSPAPVATRRSPTACAGSSSGSAAGRRRSRRRGWPRRTRPRSSSASSRSSRA